GSGLARSIASQTSLAESPSLPFAFVAELFMCGPPGRGTLWFHIFIQAPSPEIWSETISGGEEVLARKWGGLFLGYLLGKKDFRRRDRDHLVPPRRMDAAVCRAEVCYAFCRKARERPGGAPSRIHHAARRHGSGLAARGAQQPGRIYRDGRHLRG